MSCPHEQGYTHNVPGDFWYKFQSGTLLKLPLTIEVRLKKIVNDKSIALPHHLIDSLTHLKVKNITMASVRAQMESV